jgi:TolB-like protein/DNA-binding SARP family transcriptional activator
MLGNLAVLRHGTSAPLPRSKKTRALLAYLAMTARPHSRDRLCAMFWAVPDDPRAALRWSLTRLRPLVDEHDCRRIIADRESVGFDLDRVTVDILSLRNAARNGTDAISTDALHQATEALEGDFLEGLDLPDCHEFQNWCTGEREDTRRLRVRLLAALITRLEDMPDEALRHARTLSLLEPANEAAQAMLVRLLRIVGRSREAEEQFQSAQRQLEEFNVPRTGALRQAAQLSLRAGARTPADDISAAPTHVEPPPARPAIAVLPFINMSGEPEQEYFSDGISEDIITALSKLRWFVVIARNSSFSYKNKSVPMKQIAEELAVGYIVEGSVRKSGDRVRITAQLNDAATGNQLWAERYDRSLADVFAVQDEITEAVVAAIEPQVYAAENFRAQRKPPESLDAWDLVMRALSHFWRVTPEDNVAAQKLLEKAIAIDPNYAQALAVFAVSHTFGALIGWENRAVSVPVAERAALAAIRADSEDPWAHLALAGVYVCVGRFEDTLAELEQALYLNPNFSLAQAYYGLALSYAGRWEEGINAARRALRLSPRDPFSGICIGVVAYAEFVGRNYREAMRLAREGIRQRLDFARRVFTAAAAMAGEIELAKASLQELRRAQPNISLAWIAEHILVTQDERDRYSETFRCARELYVEAFRRAGLE